MVAGSRVLSRPCSQSYTDGLNLMVNHGWSLVFFNVAVDCRRMSQGKNLILLYECIKGDLVQKKKGSFILTIKVWWGHSFYFRYKKGYLPQFSLYTRFNGCAKDIADNLV